MAKEPNDQTILSWKAPEFLHYKKSHWWFPLQALATVVLVVLFVLTNEYIAAIIVVLGAIILYQLAHEEPEVLPVTFTTDGVRFKGHAVRFADLKTFWITETDHVKKLHLQKIERFTLPIVIPLIKQDVDKIRDFLSHYLPETTDMEEDFADKLNRWLRI